MNNKNYRGVGLIHRYHKLNHSSPKCWRIILKPTCASTEIELSNWIAKKPVKENNPIAIFSNCQRFGQGQAGRIWQAPMGGVWVSAAIKREGLSKNNSQLYGLAVALALVERIERIGINIDIKWRIKWPRIREKSRILVGTFLRCFLRFDSFSFI